MARSHAPGRVVTLKGVGAPQSCTTTDQQRYFRNGWEGYDPGGAEAIEPALGTILRGADVPPGALFMEVEAHTRGNTVMSFPGAVSDPGEFFQWSQEVRSRQGTCGHNTVDYTEDKHRVQERIGFFVNFCWSTCVKRTGPQGPAPAPGEIVLCGLASFGAARLPLVPSLIPR